MLLVLGGGGSGGVFGFFLVRGLVGGRGGGVGVFRNFSLLRVLKGVVAVGFLGGGGKGGIGV